MERCAAPAPSLHNPSVQPPAPPSPSSFDRHSHAASFCWTIVRPWAGRPHTTRYTLRNGLHLHACGRAAQFSPIRLPLVTPGLLMMTMASPQCLSLVPMLPGPAATSLVWRIEVSSGMHWTAVASCSPFHGPDADMTENPSAPSWVSSTWSRLARGSLRRCSFQSTPPLRHQPTAIRPRDPPGRPGSISPPVAVPAEHTTAARLLEQSFGSVWPISSL